jgi:Fur family iron response transcriptional regulator
MRPTRHRVFLCSLPFGNGERHLTAELLFNEAAKTNVPASLATVYNTLKLFTEAGMLRKIATDGARTFYDTNLRDHHHFFIKRRGC